MKVFVFVLSVNVQHTEQNALLYRPIQIYIGAEVSHTNRCRSVRRTLRHWCRSVLVPKCPESIDPSSPPQDPSLILLRIK